MARNKQIIINTIGCEFASPTSAGNRLIRQSAITKSMFDSIIQQAPTKTGSKPIIRKLGILFLA